MMVLFAILGLMTAAAVTMLTLPLIRARGAIASRADYDISIYRDQLDELERDVERGLINADERASARTEIQRRILSAEAANQEGGVTDTGGRGIFAGFAIMLLVPLTAGGLYLVLGSPGVIEQPFATRPVAPSQISTNPDIEAMVSNLAARLRDEPDDIEGWLMLGRSYAVLERRQAAVTALERAWKLDGKDPNIIAGLAENRLFAAGGIVSPAVIADLETLQSIDPDHPAARFYLGLAHAQAGEYQIAFDEWIAFARESPVNAPWMKALREQILGLSKTFGRPMPDDIEGISAVPGPDGGNTAAVQ